MPTYWVRAWSPVLGIILLVACSDPYEPTPAHLIGEFSGRAGTSLETYHLFLAIDEVSDSARGLWSLSFQATCATHDGPFSGILDGDELRLRLQPNEDYEATLDLSARVLPGDSVLMGTLTLVARGNVPTGPALCGSDQLDRVTLHYGEVPGLPIGR